MGKRKQLLLLLQFSVWEEALVLFHKISSAIFFASLPFM